MNNFKKRRLELLKQIPDKSIIFLYSNSLHKCSEDSFYDFFVNRNFYYLTNISQENSLLVLIKNNNNFEEYLFIDEFNEKKEKWFGRKLKLNEAKTFSEIDNVLFNNSFQSKFISFLELGLENFYFDMQCNEETISNIKKQISRVNLLDIYPLIRNLRMIKDELEIKNIKEAIKITHKGLNKIVKELATAKSEREIYNAFNHEILNHGTNELGFPSIIGSGVHTCCLHYPNPIDKIPSNSIILCDVGSAYNHYSSDVTRTFPTSKKFTDYQKMVYEIVLNTNKKVIEYIRPGLTLNELQEYAKSILASGCIEKGIINNSKELEKYYFHGISHHLGLDVHDVSDRAIPLKEGMVITVEPGLYIEENKTGIRIEDDVMITSNGCEVLTREIPKEIKDIEKLF